MFKQRIAFIVILFLGACQSSICAEYPWFKVHGFEGWIEYASQSGADRRINVLPRLYGPSFVGEFGGADVDMSNLLTVKPDGEMILKFLVMGNLGKLPQSFRSDLHQHLTGTGFNRAGFTVSSLNSYQIVMPKIINLKAALIVNGEVKQLVDVPNTYIGAEYIGEFRIRPEEEIYGNIQNADFKIQLDYEFPYQLFSSASINFSQQILTKIKVEVFRQVIRQVRTSGTKFLWMDFRSTYVRTIEKERIATSASAQYHTKLDIVLRDPEENIVKFIDELIGKKEITKDKLIEQHEKLIATANQNNNPVLGKLAKEYMEAVRADDHTGQVNALEAISKLSEGDVLGFMAAGMSFSESSSGGTYTYVSTLNSTISTSSTETYSQHVIKTVKYSFQTTVDNFPMLAHVIRSAQSQQMIALFGSVQPTPAIVDQVLVTNVLSNNLPNVRYCLHHGAIPNQVVNDDQEPLLMYCLKKGYYSLASLLLNSGANPNLKNRHGESASDMIETISNSELRALITSKLRITGRVGFSIAISPTAPDFNLQSPVINVRTSELPGTISKVNGTKTWAIEAIELYPGYYYVELKVTLSIDLPRDHPTLSQAEIGRYYNAGYMIYRNGNSYRLERQMSLFDKIKVLKNGANQYRYTLTLGPDFQVTEVSGKHLDNYSPTLLPMNAGPGFNFEVRD